MRKCLNDHSSSFYKLPMNLTKYGGNFSAVFKIILHWCQTEIFYIEVVCWLFVFPKPASSMTKIDILEL